MIASARQRQRGATIFEAVAGLVVIGIVITLTTRAIITIDRGWRLDRQQRMATRLLRDAMELATALPWSDVTDAAVSDAIDDARLTSFPKAELNAEVAIQGNAVVEKRVRLTLSWEPEPDTPRVTRVLTAWVYEMEEGSIDR